MITFFKDVLKSNTTIMSVTAAGVLLWLLAVITFFSALSDFRLKKHYDSARTAYLEGDKTSAIKELNAALAIDRTLGQAYVLAGKIAFEEEDYENAREYFEDAAKFGKSTADIKNAIAVTRILPGLAAGGVDREGKRMLQQAAEDYADNGDAYASLGSVYLYEDNASDAASAYEKALATANVSYDGLVALYNGLGVVQTRKAGSANSPLLQKAEEYFNKAEHLAPGSPEVLANKVMLQFARTAGKLPGDTARRTALQRADDFLPTSTEKGDLAYVFHHNAALWYYSKNEFEKAIREADKAIDIRPAEKIDQFNKAVAALGYARKKKDDATIKSLDEMLFNLGVKRVPPEDLLRLYAELAAVEYAVGMREAAEKHLAKAEELVSEKTPKKLAAKIYRGLAVINFDKSALSASLDYVRKAHNADPEMEDILAIEERLSAAPSVSHITVLRRDYLLDCFPAIKAEVYNRSSIDPLIKEDISVVFGDTPGLLGFANNSYVIAVPQKPLKEGSHIAKLIATDDLGNKAQATESIVIDRTPPYPIISPQPGNTLTPGYPTFTIQIRDDITAVDYRTIKLAVFRESEDGRVENYVLVQDGKFTDRAGLDLADVFIKNDQFSFQLKTRLRPGQISFILQAADQRGNKMNDYKWKYPVREEE